MIKLVAIDTDGTLLNSQGEIQDSTKEAISKALDRGVKVVLCSGRPIAGPGPLPWYKGRGPVCRNLKRGNQPQGQRGNHDQRLDR